VIPFQFDYAGAFRTGWAFVEKHGKQFYINKKGEFVKGFPK